MEIGELSEVQFDINKSNNKLSESWNTPPEHTNTEVMSTLMKILRQIFLFPPAPVDFCCC